MVETERETAVHVTAVRVSLLWSPYHGSYHHKLCNAIDTYM